MVPGSWHSAQTPRGLAVTCGLRSGSDLDLGSWASAVAWLSPTSSSVKCDPVGWSHGVGEQARSGDGIQVKVPLEPVQGITQGSSCFLSSQVPLVPGTQDISDSAAFSAKEEEEEDSSDETGRKSSHHTAQGAKVGGTRRSTQAEGWGFSSQQAGGLSLGCVPAPHHHLTLGD